MEDGVYTPEGLPDGIVGDNDHGTIDNLSAALSAANQPYAPEGLAEQYAGKSNTEIIDGLMVENTGFRQAQSNLPPVAKGVDEFIFEPSETVAPYFPQGENGAVNPTIEIARQAAFDAGVQPEAFNKFINGVYGKLGEANLLHGADQDIIALDKIDSAKEYSDFGTAAGISGDAEISAKVDELQAYGKAFVAGNNLGEGAEVEIEVLSQTSAGLSILNALQSSMIERGVQVGGDVSNAGGMSDDEFATLGGSREIDPSNSSVYDPVLAKTYEDEMMRRSALKAKKA